MMAGGSVDGVAARRRGSVLPRRFVFPMLSRSSNSVNSGVTRRNGEERRKRRTSSPFLRLPPNPGMDLTISGIVIAAEFDSGVER